MSSSQDPVIRLLAQAAESLRRGSPKDAVSKSEEALRSNPDCGEALLILGVAESQLNRRDAATAHLRRATDLLPDRPHARYNLAVHLQNNNDASWRSEAEAVLELSPEHEGARKMLGRPVAAVTPDRPYAPGPFTYMGGQDEKTHSLSFLEGREKLWQGMGWTLVVFGALVTLGLKMHMPFALPEINAHTRMAGAPKTDPLSILIIAGWIGAGVLTFMFLLADMVDRRARFMWLIPLTACCFLGIPAAPLAMYLAMGRK